MANTSVSLGPHWEAFIAEKVGEGRYGSASEMVRAGLRLLEEYEGRVARLRDMIAEGEVGEGQPFDGEEWLARMRDRHGLEAGHRAAARRDVA